MDTNMETGGSYQLQRPIFLLAVGATLLASIGFSGCATKGFVRRELETVRGEMATGQVEMRDQMTHRGPDDAGTYISKDRRLGFGHRRLAIVDLSPAGHQPMPNEDETVCITFNGEIYNH